MFYITDFIQKIIDCQSRPLTVIKKGNQSELKPMMAI